MKSTWIGIAVATVVLYVWGFLYWGAIGLPQTSWQTSSDDSAAAQALREHFPENGVYHVPAMHHDKETLEKLFEAGPIAMVHIVDKDGGPTMDSAIMIWGFVLNFVVVCLIALLLRQLLPALPTYTERLRFTTLAGITAAVLIDVGDIVWWKIAWIWKLYQAFYDVSAWFVAGLILAAFIKPTARAAMNATT